MMHKQIQQDKAASNMSLVTHISTDEGLIKLIKPEVTHANRVELSYLLGHKRELDDIEKGLISKSCNNIFDDTIKPALSEIRTSKQYVRVRSNYLCGLMTEPRYGG